MAYSGQCIVMCLSSVYVYEYACVISASRHLLKYTYFHSTEVLGDDLYLPLGGSLSGNDDADEEENLPNTNTSLFDTMHVYNNSCFNTTRISFLLK